MERKTDAEEIRVWCDNGADINAPDKDGKTPFHILVYNLGNFYEDEKAVEDMIEECFKKGAKVNAQAENGSTPFSYLLAYGLLCTKNPLHLVKRFIDFGADVTKKCLHDRTALHQVAPCEYLSQMIDLFLDNGANINAQDKDQRTPLHYAVLYANHDANYYGNIECFLKKKANPNMPDNQGKTVLHYLVKLAGDYESNEKYVEAIGLLIEYGADKTIPDNQGNTPCSLAEQISDPDIRKKVLESLNKNNWSFPKILDMCVIQ